MSNQLETLKKVNSVTPSAMLEIPEVESHFQKIWIGANSDGNSELAISKAEAMFASEKFSFMKILSENPKIAGANKISLYNVFMQSAVLGLSIAPEKNLVYVLTRSAKIKLADGKDGWEDRAYVVPTPYGELALRQKWGHIKYADNPVLVYQGDEFYMETNGAGQLIPHHKKMMPRLTNIIVAAYIRLVRPDGTSDFHSIDIDEIKRLSTFSAKQNAKWENGQRVSGAPNALYSSDNGQVDPGFMVAKLIKHAFKNYPKAPAYVEKAGIKMDDEPVVINQPVTNNEPLATQDTSNAGGFTYAEDVTESSSHTESQPNNPTVVTDPFNNI